MTFLLKDFNSSDLISWDFISSSHIILGKKSQESETQDFISSDSYPRTLENWDFLPKFLFPGFLPRNFFPDTLTYK